MFFETNNINVEQKHNSKSGKKAKIRERNFKEKTRQETQKEKGVMKKHFAIQYFDVVPFMKQKQRRQKNKERDKNKEPKESQKRTTRRKNERKEQERDRERETDKGGRPKRAKEKQRETFKNKQKCPFLGEKNRYILLKAKKGKDKKPNKQNKQTKIRRV